MQPSTHTYEQTDTISCGHSEDAALTHVKAGLASKRRRRSMLRMIRRATKEGWIGGPDAGVLRDKLPKLMLQSLVNAKADGELNSRVTINGGWAIAEFMKYNQKIIRMMIAQAKVWSRLDNNQRDMSVNLMI